MTQDGRRDLTVLGVLLAVAAVLVLGVWWFADRPNPFSTGTGTTGGNVVTYDGRTYWVSGERVADASLGEVVATGVAYQDTTADLRAVRGFAPDQVLAAYIPAQRAGQSGPGWTFVAVDQGLGTDPLADPSASAVLQR
ncbi:MAG TPA: hypothetical protein VFL59_13300 [Candidatus Nanopelagicales bacterium]|nr:hypothetical protein [Candidatus Nanopelagicales bacterium]